MSYNLPFSFSDHLNQARVKGITDLRHFQLHFTNICMEDALALNLIKHWEKFTTGLDVMATNSATLESLLLNHMHSLKRLKVQNLKDKLGFAPFENITSLQCLTVEDIKQNSVMSILDISRNISVLHIGIGIPPTQDYSPHQSYQWDSSQMESSCRGILPHSTLYRITRYLFVNF